MKSSNLKKLLAATMAATLGVSCFVGCGSDDEKDGGGTASDEQSLVYNVGAEVKTIDPALCTATDGGTIIINAFEGLMRVDENDEPQLAAAESVDVSDDGLVYTFHLREDGKWSDGEKVTANDFKYAWVRTLTKDTGAEYAYQLFYIKGAEDYYNGEGDESDLGIDVVDDYTLKVTLEAPTSYFLQLCTFQTYMPEREDIVSADPDGWTLEPETYVTNGPFKLVQYDMKDKYVFEKNDEYWDADSVKLDKLTYTMVNDEDTAYASLKSGDMDMISSVPTDEIEKGQEEGLVTIYPYIGTYFYCVNVGKNDGVSEEVQKVLENKLVRQALNCSIDRKALVEKVTKGGQTPAYSFVPTGILKSDGTEFADTEYFDGSKADIEKAKTLLKEAGYENGEGMPTLELKYNTSEGNKDIAEVIQQSWAAIGVNVELSNEEWAVFQDSRTNGNYEIARHGWIGDYSDPMTFLDLWVTGGGNNDSGYSNEEYDKLIAESKAETDPVKREELMRKAEDILMDDMPIIPLYYYTNVMGAQKDVKDAHISSLGYVTFKDAYRE